MINQALSEILKRISKLERDANRRKTFDVPAARDDGWTPGMDTWVYVSAASFKIEGKDVSALFPIGTRIKLTQTTVKYFVVTAAAFSTDTAVTVTGGSDYTVADATITSPYYSYQECPQGFPDWFNWTPVLTGFSADPTNSIYRFCIHGRVVTCAVRQGTAGTSNATTFRISLPVNAVSTSNYGWYGSVGFVVNSGTLATDGGFAITAAANTYIVVNRADNAAWTDSGDKRAAGGISYEI